MRLYCATGNPGKLREFRLAAGLRRSRSNWRRNIANSPECIEDGATFEENAILKARHYSATPRAGCSPTIPAW